MRYLNTDSIQNVIFISSKISNYQVSINYHSETHTTSIKLHNYPEYEAQPNSFQLLIILLWLHLQQCRHANNEIGSKNATFSDAAIHFCIQFRLKHFFLCFFFNYPSWIMIQKHINYCLRFSESALSCALTN